MTLVTSCGVLLNSQYAAVKLMIPPPKPHSWSLVISEQGLMYLLQGGHGAL